MEFRWAAFIALWTLISGPIFGTSSGPAKPSRVKAKVSKMAKYPTAKAPARR